MQPISTDAELVAQSVLKPALFGRIYDRHSLAVRRYAGRRVGPDVAEDLAAEVFVRAFRARERYRAEHETALPWLLGVANHVISEHRRQEKRRLIAIELLAGRVPQPYEYESERLSADVVHELRSLADADRDALLLVVWGELSYEEAALALGVPAGTVASRVARARRRLAKVLQPHAAPPRVRLSIPEATRA